MGRKEKRRGEERGREGAPAKETPIISKRGWRIIAAGAAIAILGYIVLSLTDPKGQNFASKLSPILILSGYITIGAGILARDRAPEEKSLL